MWHKSNNKKNVATFSTVRHTEPKHNSPRPSVCYVCSAENMTKDVCVTNLRLLLTVCLSTLPKQAGPEKKLESKAHYKIIQSHFLYFLNWPLQLVSKCSPCFLSQQQGSSNVLSYAMYCNIVPGRLYLGLTPVPNRHIYIRCSHISERAPLGLYLSYTLKWAYTKLLIHSTPPRLLPKWDPIPYIVHYIWPGPIVHYIWPGPIVLP